ncbi:MAG: hypothetical protein IKK83_01645 [Clostridia bacterium]|nr:hypothetical protein [Clostridia bacterium]
MKKNVIAIMLLFAMLLTACGGTSEEGGSVAESSAESSEAEAAVADYTVIKDGEAVYTVIRSAELSKDAADLVLAFNGRVKEATGKYLKVVNDADKKGEATPETPCEILVGDTNRRESADAKAALEPYTYAIKFVEGKVVIVGYNNSLLCDALEYFCANYLTDDKVEKSEGYLKLLHTEDCASVSGAASFAELIGSAPSLDSEAKQVYTVPRPDDEIKTVQGGCLVGKYFYQAFLKKDTASDEENNIVRIVKYDTEAREVEKESADLPLNHANDITYNSKLDTLVVVHNNPNRTHISFVDPDTLEITATKKIEHKIYCIDYNASTDTYVIGLSGGQSFRILDADFKSVSEEFQPTEQTSGYTTQGCACDDNYIYFVLYNKNVITVYNWQGEFVTLITLNVGAIEPENISIAGDTLYVGCAGSGCRVFEVSPIAP